MLTAIHHHVLPSVSLSIHPCICPSTSSSSHPSIYLATHAFIWSSTLLAIFRSSVHLSINLSNRHVDNKTMLLDFCWQHQKRSNSARLSHFLQLKTSKTKPFCEPSFKNGKLTVQLTASYQCVLRFFHAVSLKYCACHEKASPGHTKCFTCHEIASWHS